MFTSYNYVEIMKTHVLLILFLSCYILGHHEDKNPEPYTDKTRGKRSAVGALHIVTNHAQPIHADVKADSESEKVTPPENAQFELKSFRKALHLPAHPVQKQPVTTIELVRKISRSITFIVSFISVLFEFFTIFNNLITSLRSLMID